MTYRKIAVVGLASTTHDDAPFEDNSWEKWGLPWDERSWPFLDRYFDIHPLECIREAIPSFYSHGYEDRLRDLNPLYMQEAYPDIPNAIKYPLQRVSALVGDYFNSSVAYMIALAIDEAVDEIGLWGIDMDGPGDEGHCNEYGDQRPNCEYLLGFARARGITIHLPPECPILKFRGEFPLGKLIPDYEHRYGYLRK